MLAKKKEPRGREGAGREIARDWEARNVGMTRCWSGMKGARNRSPRKGRRALASVVKHKRVVIVGIAVIEMGKGRSNVLPQALGIPQGREGIVGDQQEHAHA